MINVELITKKDLIELEKRILQSIKEYMEPVQKNEWIKSKDVMLLLGISASKLQTLRINQTIPYSKVGGTYYYNKANIFSILEKELVK